MTLRLFFFFVFTIMCCSVRKRLFFKHTTWNGSYFRAHIFSCVLWCICSSARCSIMLTWDTPGSVRSFRLVWVVPQWFGHNFKQGSVIIPSQLLFMRVTGRVEQHISLIPLFSAHPRWPRALGCLLTFSINPNNNGLFVLLCNSSHCYEMVTALHWNYPFFR